MMLSVQVYGQHYARNLPTLMDWVMENIRNKHIQTLQTTELKLLDIVLQQHVFRWCLNDLKNLILNVQINL